MWSAEQHGDGEGMATESGIMPVLNERAMEVILTEETLPAADRPVKANEISQALCITCFRIRRR